MLCMNIFIIDIGIINICVMVWCDDVVFCQVVCQVGVCDIVIIGNWMMLQCGVQDIIEVVLQKVGFGMSQVDLVLVFGMIIFNVGLYEVLYLVVLVGLCDLVVGMVQVIIFEVCVQLIWFVLGVCNLVDNFGLYNIELMDMMCGEEVEMMGLVLCFGIMEFVVIVLLGLYLKFVYLDVDQCIIGCVMMLVGELLYVIMYNIILVDVFDFDFVIEVDLEMLLFGVCSVSSIGLGCVCFMVCMLGQFMIYECNVWVNFLLGVVLGVDLFMFKNSSVICMNLGMQFVIMGKLLLCEVLVVLVLDDDFFLGKVIVISSEQQEYLVGSGVIVIVCECGLVKILKVV